MDNQERIDRARGNLDGALALVDVLGKIIADGEVDSYTRCKTAALLESIDHMIMQAVGSLPNEVGEGVQA